MANTCFNSIRVSGPAEQISKLAAALTDIFRDKNRHTSMMRSLLTALGYDEASLGDVDLREDFQLADGPEPVKVENGVLFLSSESAWSFLNSTWALVRKALPGTEIWYLAEEYSCDVFVTNDRRRRFFTTKWFLDSEEVEPMYFDDDRSLIEYVHDNCDSTVSTMIDLRRFLDDAENEDRFFSLHEISYEFDKNLVF